MAFHWQKGWMMGEIRRMLISTSSKLNFFSRTCQKGIMKLHGCQLRQGPTISSILVLFMVLFLYILWTSLASAWPCKPYDLYMMHWWLMHIKPLHICIYIVLLIWRPKYLYASINRNGELTAVQQNKRRPHTSKGSAWFSCNGSRNVYINKTTYLFSLVVYFIFCFIILCLKNI